MTPSTVTRIAERVVWTFVQAFFGALASAQLVSLPTVDGAKKLVGSALAAGVAAVISLAKNLTAAQAAKTGAAVPPVAAPVPPAPLPTEITQAASP